MGVFTELNNKYNTFVAKKNVGFELGHPKTLYQKYTKSLTIFPKNVLI
jgi:hypothetical protein